MKKQEVPRVGQKIADVGTEGGGLVAKMSLWLQQQLRLRGRNPDAAVTTLMYAASPVWHMNETDFDQDILITGGTVSSVAFTRNNGASYTALPTSGLVRLNPGDALLVTYSAPPDIRVIPR